MQLPDLSDRRIAQSASFGHSAPTPVSGVAGLFMKRFSHDFPNYGIVVLRVSPWPRGVLFDSRQTALQVSQTPSTRLLTSDSKRLSNLLIVSSLCGQQYDLSSFGQPDRSSTSFA